MIKKQFGMEIFSIYLFRLNDIGVPYTLCNVNLSPSGCLATQIFSSINLAADFDDVAQQLEKIEQIQQSLKDLKINLDFEMSETLHDREIEFDNGWIIKIGRGLDYFKRPPSKLAIGKLDFDLRECHETTIDIFSTR